MIFKQHHRTQQASGQFRFPLHNPISYPGIESSQEEPPAGNPAPPVTPVLPEAAESPAFFESFMEPGIMYPHLASSESTVSHFHAASVVPAASVAPVTAVISASLPSMPQQSIMPAANSAISLPAQAGVQKTADRPEVQKIPGASNAPGRLHIPQFVTWKRLNAAFPGKQEKYAITAVSVFAALILAGICVFLAWSNMKAADVTVYRATAQSITQSIGGGGMIYPRQRFDLSYPFPERVVDVLVKSGDKITLNQPLLRLDPTQLNIQVKQASDNMAAAQAYLANVTASGNTLAIAQAQQQFNLAKNKYNALVAQSSFPLLHNGELVSPLDGVITTIAVDPGEVFPADTTLLTIMDESVVVVRAKVPLASLQQVALGQHVLVTPSALANRTFNGVVSAIIPQADPQTDTFEVWVQVPNTDHALLPGMSAFVQIQLQEKGVAVPRLAVLNASREAAVFVVREQRAYLQRVQVAGRESDTILLSSGVNSGDQVVLVGIASLRDGQQVQIRSVENRA